MRLWCFSLTLIMPYVKLMKVKKWDIVPGRRLYHIGMEMYQPDVRVIGIR